eukprot:EG_transcript_3047
MTCVVRQYDSDRLPRPSLLRLVVAGAFCLGVLLGLTVVPRTNLTALPPPQSTFPSAPSQVWALGRREALGSLTAASVVVGLGSNAPEAGALGFTKEKKPKGGGLYIPDEAFVDMGNGLRYADFRQGTGASPKLGDQAVIHVDVIFRKITVFTSRQGMGVTGGNPYGFEVGRYGGPGGAFMKAIDLGVIGMREGGQRRLIVPPELGYGNRQMQEILPGSTITVDIELLSVKDSSRRGGLNLPF